MNKSPSIVKLILPNLNDTLFIAIFLSALILGPKMLNIDGDLPRHLLMGKIVLETGFPPTQEIFSYVYEGRPYIPHEWLAGVIYYTSYILFGLNGVVLLSGALIATTFWFIYSQTSSRHNEKFQAFILVVFGALVTSIHWIARPHLFTMLFLAIWLILTDRLARGSKIKLWAFPLLMLAWGNIHAEFIAGFLILLAYITGWFWQFLFAKTTVVMETGKRLFAVILVSFLASLINPSGLKTWDIVLGYINNRYLLSRITETQPPNFTQIEYLPLLILLTLSTITLIVKRKNFTPAHFFLLTGFGAMSLFSARNAHLFGVVAPFIVSLGLSGIRYQPLRNIEATVERVESQINENPWRIIATILVSAMLITGPSKNYNRFEPSIFPVDAVQWLENNPQSGQMFNAFDWGGYILFHLWPEQKVFIESQTDVKGEVTQKYEIVVTLQDGWQEVFEEYRITWAIIQTRSPLAVELSENQNWETIYKDDTAVILLRTQLSFP